MGHVVLTKQRVAPTRMSDSSWRKGSNSYVNNYQSKWVQNVCESDFFCNMMDDSLSFVFIKRQELNSCFIWKQKRSCSTLCANRVNHNIKIKNSTHILMLRSFTAVTNRTCTHWSLCPWPPSGRGRDRSSRQTRLAGQSETIQPENHRHWVIQELSWSLQWTVPQLSIMIIYNSTWSNLNQ